MGAIRFGVFLPQYRMSFAEIEEKVRRVEALGYDSVWFIDHMAAPLAEESDYLEAWTLASALAARTQRIRLGHLVLCNELRHPALLAKMAATLDQISGGRLELGLGWGSVAEELRRYGFGDDPPAVRAARLAESVEILKRLFTGERVDFEGRFFQLRGALARPRPVRGEIPLHIGGAGRKLTLPLVAKHATWWSCPSYGTASLAELRPLAGAARVSAQHPVALVTDPSRREDVTKLAERRFGSWGGLLVGTAPELAASLSREVSLGVEMFVLQFHDFAAPATLEAFAQEVVPAVQAAVPGEGAQSTGEPGTRRSTST